MQIDTPQVRRIGLSLGDTENLRDGLGEFSVQLGKRIAQKAPELKAKYHIEIYFHVRESLKGIFGKEVSYLQVSKNHRWFHYNDIKFDIWHNFHQLNRTRPPIGTLHRIATVHDLNFLYFKSGYSLWRDTRRMRRTLSRMTHLIAISNYVKDDFIKKMKWSKQIEVIYNGTRNLSQAAKRPLPHLIEKQFIFHLSRMAKSKNVDSILRLAKVWPEMTFVLSGPESRDSDHVLKVIKELALTNVELITNIDDEQKAWLYEQCAAFIFPSITEGFGLPPIEAMHFGKPVFLSRLTSLPEIGGAQAIYFDDFSAESMRGVMQLGIHQLQAQKEQIQKHAQIFDWDICAKSYINSYLQLLKLAA